VSGALRLVPRAVTRPWGGQRIAQTMGWDDPGPVGEWWLASCHEHGVTDLGQDGTPLPAFLDGPKAPAELPGAHAFPLLLKFLDTSQVLSVQVHPDNEVAASQGLPNGKTEAWHILAAEPTACLFVGTAEDVSTTDLLDAVEDGAGRDQMAHLLRRVPAVPGETWLVEAGTIHAVGPGVTLFEIQQSSDATWRIYDWEREPKRDVHMTQARDAARDLPEAHPAPPPGDEPGWHLLVRCGAFSLQHGRVVGELALVGDAPWGAVTVLGGTGTLTTDSGTEPLAAGDTLLTWGGGTLSGDGLTVLVSSAAG
jgi:mannose-6-phosphate isomerase